MSWVAVGTAVAAAGGSIGSAFLSSKKKGESTFGIPLMLPGQEKALKRIAPEMESTFWGSPTSEITKNIMSLAKRPIQQQVNQGMTQLAETAGMTQPSLQKGATELQKAGVQGMAGIPMQTWQEALKYLTEYTLSSQQILNPQIGAGGSSELDLLSMLLGSVSKGASSVLTKKTDTSLTPLSGKPT